MPTRSEDHDKYDSATLYAACGSDEKSERADAYRELWTYLVRVALQVVHDEPDAEALAQDCGQVALIRVHERLAECREPRAFRTWARRIVSHLAIDELRRRKRQLALSDVDSHDETAEALTSDQPPPETEALARISQADLRYLIDHAPISNRSRRVVLGRYLDDVPDESLAEIETGRVARAVRPSHIQVTRAKNLAKLRDWPPIRTYLGSAG